MVVCGVRRRQHQKRVKQRKPEIRQGPTMAVIIHHAAIDETTRPKPKHRAARARSPGKLQRQQRVDEHMELQRARRVRLPG